MRGLEWGRDFLPSAQAFVSASPSPELRWTRPRRAGAAVSEAVGRRPSTVSTEAGAVVGPGPEPAPESSWRRPPSAGLSRPLCSRDQRGRPPASSSGLVDPAPGAPRFLCFVSRFVPDARRQRRAPGQAPGGGTPPPPPPRLLSRSQSASSPPCASSLRPIVDPGCL